MHSEDRLLQYHIKQLEGPINMDMEEAELLQSNEQRFLSLALANYRKCVPARVRACAGVGRRGGGVLCTNWQVRSNLP